MKTRLIFSLLLVLASLSASAQKPDFDLYFANNVTDVENFDEIKNPDSGLTWTKVQTATGDMSGNYVEVDKVKQMLGSTRKKWLADQQQFWTMRDHSLLCFRIEDEHPTTAGYEVMLDNQNGDTLVLAANDYFFVNLPMQADPYVIKVYRTGEQDKFYLFRYFINDWDDENLYIFQLDQKRQATGKNYTLECTTGSLDEDGELETTTTELDLQATSFQSLYVPENQDLLDVILNDDGNKLRLDLTKLHTGIDLNDRFSYMELTKEFILDKHENREFLNFNWVGSGLFEKYDTLYLSVWNDKARLLTSITCHVETVDADGNPAASVGAKYIGYDKDRKAHKILTMGKPAYIEIISRGYLPTVYKYEGAADEQTGIVSEARCIANLTLKSGTVSASGLAISDQHFLNLLDKKNIIVRNGEDHCLCVVEPIDLAGWVQADTLVYCEDAGQQYPKVLNNKSITRYAKMQVAFARPKGSAEPDCSLFATDIHDETVCEATDKEISVLSASRYTSFTYDYYYVDFDLLDVIPVGSVCSLKLTSNDLSYNEFPFLKNYYMDREESQEAVDEEVNNNWAGDSQMDGTFSKAGIDVRLPFDFKVNFKPVTVKTAWLLSVSKRLATVKITVEYRRNDKDTISKEVSKARQEYKDAQAYEMLFEDEKRDKGLKLVGSDASFSGWVYDEIDDIFNISSKRIGTGWFGNAKMSFALPEFDLTRFQVKEVAGQIGYGVGMYWGNLGENPLFKPIAGILKKIEDYISFYGCAEASAQLDFGIKSFSTKTSMSSTTMGYFARFSAKASAGATLQFNTPQKIAGLDIGWLFNARAGLQFGGKLGFQAGLEGPFDSYAPGMGVRLTGLVIGRAFISIKTFFFSWTANAGFHIGGQLLAPDTPYNPFHSQFPYWLDSSTKARPMGIAYRKLPAPTSSDFGTVLANDLAIDANPHFLDEKTIVYNDLKTADNYNDDQVTLHNTEDNSTYSLSTEGTTATNHMRSKRGDHEIVVFEQKGRVMTDEEVNADDAVAISLNMPTHIKASMRTEGGEWTTMNVTEPEEGGMQDIKPVVTIQEDGHAAVVYQRGAPSAIDPSIPLDSIENVTFAGQLMLKTFDGTHWSEPTPLYFPLDRTHVITSYDLLMRNDTVLVAANIMSEDMAKPVLRYASKTTSSDEVSYLDDNILPSQFMMHRVGRHAVIAMVYEAADSVPDIYVRTLAMSGRGDELPHGNLGTGYKMPGRVKIVCDRDAQDISDFAVLWTEINNVYKNDDGTNSYTDELCTMLNASRIHLGNSLQLTDPITVGAETDGLAMTDFDGFLDDAHISVVYTLGDPETGAALIMTNDKYFRNSCETVVSYGEAALLGSNSLPVNVKVRNTGTSAIQTVQAVINGETFDIEDSYVSPAKERTFTVLYPIDDNFDGYISSVVNVQFNNIFKLKRHPRHKAMSYLTQTLSTPRTRLSVADVECNVVSQSIENGVNTFVVELIDHNGLKSDMGVRVGVYAHPSVSEPLDNDAEELVKTDDFVQMGDQRKAYTTVSVRGISEPIQAYVSCHVVDTNLDTSDLTVSHIKNQHGLENPALVNLFPVSDPTQIVRPTIDGESTDHRIEVEKTDQGVILHNLKEGETIRVFNMGGINLCKQKVTASTLFVPLASHGVYVLGASDEVFKFVF